MSLYDLYSHGGLYPIPKEQCRLPPYNAIDEAKQPRRSTPSRLADNCIPMVQSFQVIQVVQIPAVTFEWIEHHPIFLVLCKHPSTDASLDWDDTMPNHFLHHLSQSSNSPGTERLFGALAIGKKVKFYRFDGKV